MIRICESCLLEYDTPPSRRPRYCSIQCAGEAKRNGETRACAQCGRGFYARPSEDRRDRRFCSKSCATTARNLTDTNPSFHRDISGERNPMFGKGLSGPAHPMFGRRGSEAPAWKGGRKHRRDGYVQVWTSSGYILEHRLIMEQQVGRPLLASEVVHHLDHDPSNNTVDNLQLLSSQAEHARLHAAG